MPNPITIRTPGPRHIVLLSRDTIERLAARLHERSQMPATARAAREFDSFYHLFAALLQGRYRGPVEVKQEIGWFKQVCKMTGDVDAAFEMARQLHCEVDCPCPGAGREVLSCR